MLALHLSDRAVDSSDEVAPGVIVDYDAHGTVIGVEIVRVSARVQAGELAQLRCTGDVEVVIPLPAPE